jgi:hypothetical protein
MHRVSAHRSAVESHLAGRCELCRLTVGNSRNDSRSLTFANRLLEQPRKLDRYLPAAGDLTQPASDGVSTTTGMTRPAFSS